MPYGGNEMTLNDVISQLDSLDDENTIYVKKPWSPDAEAIVPTEPDEGGVPEEAAKINAEYFLEIFLANEFLEGWLSNLDQKPSVLDQKPSVKDQCLRLIKYAENDA